VAAFATLLCQTAGIAAPVTADPFDGIWILDLKRSQIDPQDRPVGMTISIHTVEQSVHYDSETRYQNGRVAQMHYTARYDGPPARVTGTVGLMLPVSLKRLDCNTVEARHVRGFQVVATSRRAISEHGKLMTITTTSPQSAQDRTARVAVFVKLEDSQRVFWNRPQER
jgi:hypothetical protein